uniref:PHD-type domain-containing protein n=1 Tax=Arundo donax TaxID=35708 RepID=A0A0A9DHT3_ARUDO
MCFTEGKHNFFGGLKRSKQKRKVVTLTNVAGIWSSSPCCFVCNKYPFLFSSSALHIFAGFGIPPAFPGIHLHSNLPVAPPGIDSSMEPAEVVELSGTARSGCCKVCEEPEGMAKRFLICGHSLCPYKYYHIRCLKPKQIASDAQRDKPRWYCPSCLCWVCLSDEDDDQIILCDGCDEGYHLYCLNPPRTSVPEGEWLCPSCKAAMAKEGKMRKHEKRMLKLHRKDGAM